MTNDNTFSLSDIKKAAQKKYASVFIQLDDGEEVELVNVIRLPKEKREKLFKIQEEGNDNDVEESFIESLRLVARTRSQADRLVEDADGDLGALAEIFELYTKGTELGEASGSES